MIKVFFNDGTDAVCFMIIPDMRYVRSIVEPNIEIEKCFVTLYFDDGTEKEFEAKEIKRLESVPCI